MKYSDMFDDAQKHFSDELVDASMLSTSREMARMQISQVAKNYQVPFELAEQIAASLVKSHFGVDVDAADFAQIVRQVAEIEGSITNEGLRLWKLQGLARRAKRTYKELMECYNKDLLNQQSLQPMSLLDLRSRTETETPWLIPGWLAQGTNLLLFGDGGAGKTLLAYEWLRAIAMGESWNGYQVKSGNCLLVQCDEPEIVLRNRMDLLQLPDDAPLAVVTDWSLDAIARLRAYVEQSRPVFILIDSLSAVNASSIFSENDMEYARPILQLTKLCSEFQTTLCLIHHSNAIGRARGTRAIHNSVSEVWGLFGGETPAERILEVQKTRLGRAPGRYKFEFSEDDLGFDYRGHADDTDGASVTQEEKIRLWLYQDENRAIPFAPIEVAEACAISQPSTRKALQELWSKGLIGRKPSKSGRRGYLYSSPQPLVQSYDPAILSTDIRIAERDRSPTPDSESDSGFCDPAIPRSGVLKHKKSESEGSQDRSQPQPIQGLDLPRIAHNDPSAIQDRRFSVIVTNSLLPDPTAELIRGTRVEIFLEDIWIEATIRSFRPKSVFSNRLARQTDGYEVEVNGNKLIVDADFVRPLRSSN